MKFAYAILASLFALTTHAAVEDTRALGAIPIQNAGRIMPMDSFARIQLLELSGKSTFQKRPATDWLAEVLFDTDRANTQAVFLVNNPEVLEAVDIRATGERARYSFQQLEPGLDAMREKARRAFEIPEKERTAFERELVRLYQVVNIYLGLAHSFSFTRTDSDFAVTNSYVRTVLGLDPAQQAFSFLDIYLVASRAAPEIDRIGQLAQESWSADERALFDLSSRLFQWSRFHQGLPMTLLPIDGDKEHWMSPWDVLGTGTADETTRSSLRRFQEMARAYASGDQQAFDRLADEASAVNRAAAPDDRGIRRLDLELVYNRVDFFYRAELLYGVGFLLAFGAVLAGRPPWRQLALAAIALALIPHTAGIISRMLIMGRPPVTTLYSTFIFVGWVCVLLGLIVEYFQRNALGTIVASFCGLGLLLFSRKFDDSGDGLGVMIAVLDSNFWLATHVVTITIGYAGCVAAGIAGHLYMIKALRRAPGDPQLKSIYRAVFGLLAFGLVFSFLGTMLGGVWADQSWGRFWGWDPKENGALLIVLWCALLFHARIAGWIADLGMAAGAVLGVIVVLMAWLGINLLGVGLHSYGFISGLAIGFWTGVGIELLFVAALLPFARRS